MKDNGSSGRHKVGDRVTIVPRGKRGNYTAEYSEHGVHRRVSLKTRNKKIAIQKALRLEARLASGEDVQKRPRTISVAQALKDYLEVKKTDNRAPKTLVKYKTELENFATFAGQKGVRHLTQISARVFDQYRAARKEGRSEKSIYTEAIIIKGFVKWCHRRGLLEQDPLRFCSISKPPLIPKMAPSLEQVNLLLAKACAERGVQFAVLAFTGMRSGELKMLRPCDVDLEGGWIHVVARDGWVPKNRQSRKIPIHPRLRACLETMPRKERPFFFTAQPSAKFPAGTHHINVKHLNVSLQRLAKRLKFPTGRKNDGLVVHSLRHFFETVCVNAGIPQRVIDTWMGHTGDQSMGRVYYHLADKESQVFMAKVSF